VFFVFKNDMVFDMKKKILIIIVGLLVAGGSSYAYFENNKEFEQPSWKEYNNENMKYLLFTLKIGLLRIHLTASL